MKRFYRNKKTAFLRLLAKRRFMSGLAAVFVACSVSAACAELPSQPGFFTDFPSINQGFWYVSNGWTNGDHQACEWSVGAFSAGEKGLHMTLSDESGKTRPYTCPEMHSNAHYGYGLYEARMRIAAGSGLNTAFFTYVGIGPQSNPMQDEIDFEFLGKDPHFVQINYFTHGAGKHEVMVPLGFDASKELHNYAIEWLPNKIRWYVDGKLAHETPDGANVPSHPTSFFLSLWAGTKIEDAWLGPFHYSEPATADVAWAGFTPMGESCKFPQSMQCK